jgi:Putative Actinobacterial Holin-X, holin superfamily III
MAQGATHVATGNGQPPGASGPASDADRRRLSTTELVGAIFRMASELVSKEIHLAQEEAKANLKAELAVVKLFAMAAAGALIGLNLLLVAVVLALAAIVPAWLAALLLGLVILAISAIAGTIGWRRRVTQPLAVTRKTVTEDLQWAKERLA